VREEGQGLYKGGGQKSSISKEGGENRQFLVNVTYRWPLKSLESDESHIPKYVSMNESKICFGIRGFRYWIGLAKRCNEEAERLQGALLGALPGEIGWPAFGARRDSSAQQPALVRRGAAFRGASQSPASPRSFICLPFGALRLPGAAAPHRLPTAWPRPVS